MNKNSICIFCIIHVWVEILIIYLLITFWIIVDLAHVDYLKAFLQRTIFDGDINVNFAQILQIVGAGVIITACAYNLFSFINEHTESK